ncbi:MAG: thioredoxin domain-containing protein [archaeon]
MVVCIIAFIVLAVLSVFSAKYRPLAREAFSCVFRKLTLRKCESGLDQRLRASVSMRILERNERLGKFVYKRFEAISWVLFILTVISLFFAAQGIYYYATFGNCNGPNASPYAFCPLTPSTYHGDVTGIPALGTSPSTGPSNAKVTVIEFGCFSCPYTKEAEPFVKQLLSDYNGRIIFSYKRFPLPSHPYSTEAAVASFCAERQGKFWEMHGLLFENQSVWRKGGSAEFQTYAGQLHLDLNRFDSCLSSQEAIETVRGETAEGTSIGIYGTPTFFVNGKYVVAPKSYSELKILVDEALK